MKTVFDQLRLMKIDHLKRELILMLELIYAKF